MITWLEYGHWSAGRSRSQPSRLADEHQPKDYLSPVLWFCILAPYI